MLGSVAALLTVEPGYETAVAAALGAVADAVAVRDVGAAEAAIRLLKDDDAGRAGLLVGGAAPADGRTTRSRPELPARRARGARRRHRARRRCAPR